MSYDFKRVLKCLLGMGVAGRNLALGPDDRNIPEVPSVD
jgi:hypothetical protein